MIRVVPDTNTLVSGLLWSGLPGELLRGAVTGRWQLCSAEELLTELEVVLRRPKFQARWQHLGSSIDQTLQDLRVYLRLVSLSMPPSVCSLDPKDDMFLACAEAAQANYLVTGDTDLLSIGQIRVTRIITVRGFLTANNLPRTE